MSATTGQPKHRQTLHEEDMLELVNLTDCATTMSAEVVQLSSTNNAVDTLGYDKHPLYSTPPPDASCTWDDANDIPNGNYTDRCCIESSESCLLSYLCCECTFCCQPCRRCVSTNKVRWEKDGFSIDLTYISPRVITHGFPAAGVEHLYRNPRYMVKRFLEKYHGNHYHVFNFCAEPGRCYPAEVFDGRIRRFPFRDHQVPRLYVLHQFIECAVAWLVKDDKNVCALHCKAGKGRAGVMACCLLLRLGFKRTATDIITHYDKTRVTMKKSGRQKGLTVPSQIRYVGYYEKLLRQAESGYTNPGLLGQPLKRVLRSISLLNGPDYEYDCCIYQQVGFVGDKEMKWEGKYAERDHESGCWLINGGSGVVIAGNFELVFKKAQKRVGYTWLNTSMIDEREQLTLDKASIDKFHKDRKHKKYLCDMRATLNFGVAMDSNPMQRNVEVVGETKSR